jgi:hypothetical protein
MRRTALLPFALAPFALGPLPAGLTGFASAQDVPSGPTLTATVSQRFEIDTNLDLDDPRPGTSYLGDTRLGLGLLEESQTQSFSLDLDTGIRAVSRPDEDFEVTAASPIGAAASYVRQWASGALDTGLRYRQRRVDFTRPLTLDPNDVIVPDDPGQLEGEATERRYDGSVGLAFATDAPSSYALTFSAVRIDYSEGGNNLTPRDTFQGSGTWSLQLSPLFAGTLTARGFFYQADNVQETRTSEGELDTGVVYDPSENLRLTAGIGIVNRQQSERPVIDGIPVGGRQTTEDENGLSFRTGLSYAFEEVTVNGSLRVTTAPDTRISGTLNAVYPLPDGSINARVFQSFAGGATGGDEIRVTGGGIGLQQNLDPFSRISFDLAGSRRTNVDDVADESLTRVDFTTSLGYDLTAAVSADVGYRYRIRDEGPENADSHAVFFQIGRTFVTGF